MMLLAIDCGSTNHKVALFDEELQRQAVCTAPVRYNVRNAERVEFDPEWIWHTTLSLIRQVCDKVGIVSSEIGTISLTSQAQTFTLLAPSGQPMSAFISWADKRAVRESVELSEQLGSVFPSHCSFPSPVPQLQLSKVAWLRRHHPEFLRPETRIVSLPSFLAWRLAGLHVSDVNLAGMSGFCSCQQSDWWEPAFSLCSLEREQLGKLLALGESTEAMAKCPDLKLAPRLRVCCAGNDQTAGAYANASRSGRIVLTLGTALVVYRYAGTNPGPFQVTACWGPYPEGGFYELAACDEGCAALDWAVEQLKPTDETGFFQMAAQAAPGRVLFYPQRMHRADAWHGNAALAERIRAVLEGICFRARQMLEVELKLTLNSQPICVIGGGSQSALWLEILANVLNCPVIRGNGDILLGAAMMARPGVPLQDGNAVVIEPTPDSVALYKETYDSWVRQSRLATA